MFSKLLGDPNTRKLKRYGPLVTDINILEDDISILSDEYLRRRTFEFQQKLEKPEKQEKPVFKRVLAI